MNYAKNLRFVHHNAKIGKNVRIDPFTVIEEDVIIGDNCWIGNNVSILNGARIGDNCKIFPGAVVSAIPRTSSTKVKTPRLKSATTSSCGSAAR